jgi:uncharacterized protein YutE (UPF0331/DUF86 family)
MKHMVGFRNIAVHSYEKLQQPILAAIVKITLVIFKHISMNSSPR